MRPQIQFDPLPRRRWAMAAIGLAAAALLALALLARWGGAVEALTVAPATLPASPRGVAVEPLAPVAETPAMPAESIAITASAAAPARCPYQQLDVTLASGELRQACVAVTQVAQSGDLRSYWLAPQGVSDAALRIDTGDGVVRTAVLTLPGQGDYACDEGRCQGFAIGPRDAHGRRALSARGVSLTLVGGGGGDAAGAATRVRLSTLIIAPGDQQTAALACEGGHIAVVERSGGVMALCASGGGGVVQEAGGHRVFSLRSAAGETLRVGVDAVGIVDGVELGDLVCRGAACGGATTQPPPRGETDEPSETGRVFSFSGTTVTDGRPGGASATLNGSAWLPAF